ncbi:hypothetical protein L0665_03775 [Methanogenium marinum]|uniref:Lipoprotein n=1 Tax=Methanogenium marinum TaxID=348610 RepID=A0A9Q4KPA4_9EURY|nr:HAD family acid phosphatase [Methanogenium marinum]MDE4907730.1 hypothetical protein [Methanogenium marinum]
MSKKYVRMAAILLGAAFLLIFSAGCTTTGDDVIVDTSPAEPYTTISVSEIAESLKDKGPITAGLDLDGTAFFTESLYYYALSNIDGPNGTNMYGDDPLHNSEFISSVNNEFVGQYIPKNAAIDVIEMHVERGDNVIFITKKTSSPEERISEYIGVLFDIENPYVIFTNESSKTPYINEENVSVYYGDSDGDITDSMSADACTPYRFLRNDITLDCYNSSYNPGQYGESVIENSDY